MDHYAIAGKLLELQLKWIGAADARIAPLFAIDTAMLGVLAARAPALAKWTPDVSIFAGAAFVFLGCSILFLALATFPRLEGPPASLHFFGGIAKMKVSDYIASMLSSTNDDLTRDLYQQVHRNAEIAREKFYYIWWAVVASFCSLPCWIIAVWLISP